MKLVTYRARIEGEARAGVIQGDLVVDIAALGEALGEGLPASMLGLIDLGRPGLQALAACLDECEGTFPPGTATALANVHLLAPIPRPRKNIFGIGLGIHTTPDEAVQPLSITPYDLPQRLVAGGHIQCVLWK